MRSIVRVQSISPRPQCSNFSRATVPLSDSALMLGQCSHFSWKKLTTFLIDYIQMAFLFALHKNNLAKFCEFTKFFAFEVTQFFWSLTALFFIIENMGFVLILPPRRGRKGGSTAQHGIYTLFLKLGSCKASLV